MALLDVVKRENHTIPYMSTNTIFDLTTGQFMPGVDGSHILHGGISPFTADTGRPGLFKSSFAGSLMANAMIVHPESSAYVFESESMITNPSRYNDFIPAGMDITNRIKLLNQPLVTLTDLQDDLSEIGKEKEKNRKDYWVPTPFLDPKTGGPVMAWIPTFVLIDSYTQAMSGKSLNTFEDKQLDASDTNMFFMEEGAFKTKLNRMMSSYATKYGFYFIFTAHLGDKKDLNPRMKTPKQLQYLKQDDKIKGCGSNFDFLIMSLIQCLRAELMVIEKSEKEKECAYPDEHSVPLELSSVSALILKGKNNVSGNQLKYVMSQKSGFLKGLTNFLLLRDNNNFGLDVKGNNLSFTPLVYPDVSLKRTTIRSKLKDNYELNRALELTAQLCYIQKFWATHNLPEYVMMPVEEFATRLKKTTSPGVSDILNSTGAWSTSKLERPLMSIMDVLAILSTIK